MLTKRPDDDITPEQVMVGKCQTCGAVVSCQRLTCKQFQGDNWYSDGWYAECVKVTGAKRDGTARTCGARVAMGVKREQA